MKSIVVPVLVLFALNSSIHAQTRVVEANGQGQVVTVPLAAADNSLKQLQFYYISRNAISLPVAVALSGPAGLSGKLEAHLLTGAVEKALSDTKGWFEVQLNTSLTTKSAAKLELARASDCSWLTPQLYAQLLPSFLAIGQHPTMEEICGTYGSSDGGNGSSEVSGLLSPSSPNVNPSMPSDVGSGEDYIPASEDTPSVVAGGFLRKDTCNAKKGNRYLVRLTVNLAAIDPALYGSGFSVSIQLKEYPFKGKMASTIKPVSDGKFAPKPLVLMSSTGGYSSGEVIAVYKWSQGKPKLMRTLKIEDYVFYRGLMLARSIVSSVLTGGKGTFEITNGQSLYSVCFKLTRSRQRANGYTN